MIPCQSKVLHEQPRTPQTSNEYAVLPDVQIDKRAAPCKAVAGAESVYPAYGATSDRRGQGQQASSTARPIYIVFLFTAALRGQSIVLNSRRKGNLYCCYVWAAGLPLDA
jgi:hypothetical protein